MPSWRLNSWCCKPYAAGDTRDMWQKMPCFVADSATKHAYLNSTEGTATWWSAQAEAASKPYTSTSFKATIAWLSQSQAFLEPLVQRLDTYCIQTLYWYIMHTLLYIMHTLLLAETCAGSTSAYRLSPRTRNIYSQRQQSCVYLSQRTWGKAFAKHRQTCLKFLKEFQMTSARLCWDQVEAASTQQLPPQHVAHEPSLHSSACLYALKACCT